jgi:hypothetical protein
MAHLYKCPKCGTLYTAETQDHNCTKDECYPSTLVAIEEGSAQITAEQAASAVHLIEGLCVLVCDVSGSMSEAPFGPESGGLTKLELVIDAVHGAFEAMQSLTRKDTAYIAMVGFAKQAKLMTGQNGELFIKSVQDILDEFKSKNDLSQYIMRNCNQLDRGGTNVTEGLRLGHGLVQKTLANDLSAFGIPHSISLIEQKPFLPPVGDPINVPNIRVMIYSDGAHNQGPLTNPFTDMQPVSVLMTAFIGNETVNDEARIGANQMKEFATICPEHRQPGYFLINTRGRGEFLRRIFHMATGTSGLCSECMSK